MIIQSALKEPSKKNKESVESDPKANGAQDELFEIRSSRRHSAQMRVIVLIKCENNREEILTERKRDAIVRRHWRDRKNREHEKVFKMSSHFLYLLSSGRMTCCYGNNTLDQLCEYK